MIGRVLQNFPQFSQLSTFSYFVKNFKYDIVPPLFYYSNGEVINEKR